MQLVLLVFLGGGLGTLARFVAVAGVTRWLGTEQSWFGVLLVNVLGCLLFGLLWGYGTAKGLPNAKLLLFVTVGFLGAFTTFSTYAFDVNRMVLQGNPVYALGYVLAQNVLGILACGLGLLLARWAATGN